MEVENESLVSSEPLVDAVSTPNAGESPCAGNLEDWRLPKDTQESVQEDTLK